MRPFEIICAPMTVYVAEIGTVFPTLDEQPGQDWQLLGTNGARSMDENGVTVSHSKSYSKIRSAGATGPIKAELEQEDLMFRVNLLDLSFEGYQFALNGNIITTTAAAQGTMAHKKIGLSQSVGRTREFALIARGLSPYDEALPIQYCVPRCYDSGSPEPQFRKGGTGASLQLELTALESLADGVSEQERFGYILAGTEAALP